MSVYLELDDVALAAGEQAFSRKRRPQLFEFACRCGYRKPVSVPAGVALESWLMDYPCPGCDAINYPRVSYESVEQSQAASRNKLRKGENI